MLLSTIKHAAISIVGSSIASFIYLPSDFLLSFYLSFLMCIYLSLCLSLSLPSLSLFFLNLFSLSLSLQGMFVCLRSSFLPNDISCFTSHLFSVLICFPILSFLIRSCQHIHNLCLSPSLYPSLFPTFFILLTLSLKQLPFLYRTS